MEVGVSESFQQKRKRKEKGLGIGSKLLSRMALLKIETTATTTSSR
jgi:hypothetical protein